MKIAKTIKNNLCLGCGLCESIYPNKCKMEINNDGFYNPVFKQPLDKSEDVKLSSVCPSISIHADFSGCLSYWGPIEKIAEAWSSDEEIRYHAASGGVTTSIAIYLIKNNLVDAILQVGKDKDTYIYNSLKVSTTVDEVVKNAQSRYAPALVFNKIFQIVEGNPKKRFAFIGKPCDVATIRNLQRTHEVFRTQILYCISIFCAGMPSYNATEMAWKQSGYFDAPDDLTYRGDGWPGFFKAKWNDGRQYKISYNDSWGKVLGRALGMRCKVCPDGIGELADLAVGDSWSTNNGFPDFTEQPGRCFVMIRTQIGKTIFDNAVKKGFIVGREMDINKISDIQPYQSQRRKLTLWRLLPIEIKTGFLLKFKGVGVIRLGLKASPVKALKTFVGSWKRVF